MTAAGEAPPLLDRLFKEAGLAASPAMAELSDEERLRLLHSKTGYRDLYGRLKDLWLPVSRETGVLLYMLARSTNAHDRRVRDLVWRGRGSLDAVRLNDRVLLPFSMRGTPIGLDVRMSAMHGKL